MYLTPLITVAAIGGHCPAGGCLCVSWLRCHLFVCCLPFCHFLLMLFVCFSLADETSLRVSVRMSMSCDYRIMVNQDRFRIGLNETQIGLVAPAWCARFLFTSCSAPSLLIHLLVSMSCVLSVAWWLGLPKRWSTLSACSVRSACLSSGR